MGGGDFPGTPLSSQLGCPVVRLSGPTIRKPDNPTTRQPDNPLPVLPSWNDVLLEGERRGRARLDRHPHPADLRRAGNFHAQQVWRARSRAVDLVFMLVAVDDENGLFGPRALLRQSVEEGLIGLDVLQIDRHEGW